MSESAVVFQCLEWLALNRIYAWRNNTGSTTINGRYIKYGHPGSSDILGVYQGRMLCVECKTPTGRQDKKQKLFQSMIEKGGGIYILARSINDLERAIGHLPALASGKLDI